MVRRLLALLVSIAPALAAAQVASNAEADAVRLLRQATLRAARRNVARVLARRRRVDRRAARAPRHALPRLPAGCRQRAPTTASTTARRRSRRRATARATTTRSSSCSCEFFRDAIDGPDQLRQRVAFALSQILVTSGVDISRNYAMRHYQQIFRDHAVRQLLRPAARGHALAGHGRLPRHGQQQQGQRHGGHRAQRELRARDPAALLDRARTCSTPTARRQLDASGKPVPTYDQAEIEGFAHVFTGWTYPDGRRPAPTRNNNPRNYEGPMRARGREPRVRHEDAAERRGRAREPADGRTTSPSRTATSSRTPTSGPSSASSSSRSW